MTLTLPAPAKLNLFLHITGRRADGYHELQTVFQLLDYGDTLSFTLLPEPQLQFSCSEPALAGSDNLVLRAARLLQASATVNPGCRIHLQKRIPAGGGLGGGSSDAATTLLALNQLWQCGLPATTLHAIGLQLGADVPVFLYGHSAWAEGVGEQLQAISLPEDWFVVLTPPCQVATGRIFSHPALTRNSAPLRMPAFPFLGSKNDCESVTCQLYPEVRTALDWLGSQAEARMTGTGASVFARFTSQELASAVLARKPADLAGFVARGVTLSPLHRQLVNC
jgi:4-diphosphocytidyl-2-C-methyl-D-erythritol kinase